MLLLGIGFLVIEDAVAWKVGCLVVAGVLTRIVGAFFRPAEMASIPNLVPAAQLNSANAMNSFSLMASMTAGQARRRCVVAPARRTAAVRRRWRDVPAVVAQRGVRLPQKLPETPPSWRSLLAAVAADIGAPGCATSGTAQGCATWCCPSPSSTSSPRRWPCCCQSCSIAPRPAAGLVRLPDGSHGSWQSGGHDHRRHRAHRWRDEAGVEHRRLFAMAGATTPSFFLAANAISGLGNGVIPPRRTPARAGVQRHDDHHGRHRAAGHGLSGVLADAVDQNVPLLFAAAGVATARMAPIMTCNRSFRAFLSTRLGVAVSGQLRARPPPCRTATAATEWATSRFLRPEMRELPVATPRTMAQTPSP